MQRRVFINIPEESIVSNSNSGVITGSYQIKRGSNQS